jgi:ubiquinone/menaquinone biosynthesis C-methylase UbiE
MPQIRTLYSQFAEYYDILHADKDYAGEVKKLNQLISRYKKSKGNALLDVGCGTGRHISYFKDKFSCTGIDLNEAMLKVARKKVKGAIFKQADMTEFQLPKKFDAVTCLYCTIAYSLDIKTLKKTLINFVDHLKPGGIVIIEPYFTAETYLPNKPKLSTAESEGIKIARVSMSWRKGNLATRKRIMAIADKNRGVFSFEDVSDIALFSDKQLLSEMARAGFETKLIKKGINKEFGLYVGVKVV